MNRCALSIVRLAHAALEGCSQCAVDAALNADVVSSFHSTALLAVVPLMFAASAVWSDETVSAESSVDRPSSCSSACPPNSHSHSHYSAAGAATHLPSVEPLLAACLDVCMRCTGGDTPIALSSCSPNPLPLLHAALSSMSICASTRSSTEAGKDREATQPMLQKMKQLSGAISTHSSQMQTSSGEVDWSALHLSIHNALVYVQSQ